MVDIPTLKLRQFLQRNITRVPSGGLLPLLRRPIPLSLGFGTAPAFSGASADYIALHVGEAPEDDEYQAPGASAGIGTRPCQGSELRLGVHDALDDAEQVEGAARKPVNPR